MKAYEIMYIISPSEEETAEADNQKAGVVAAKYSMLIADNGGRCEKVDVWGKKQLAYCLQDNAFGIYTLITFFANSACIKELDRKMLLDEEVLRHMIISKGE